MQKLLTIAWCVLAFLVTTTTARAQAWLWVMPPATNTLGNSETKSVALDSLGNTYLLGKCDSPATVAGVRLPGQSFFVAKLNGLGQPQWAVRVGLPGQPITPQRLTVDAAGRVYLVGLHYGLVTLGTTTLAGAATNNVFVAALAPTGQWQWALEASGGTGNPAVAVSPRGHDLWIAGGYLDTLTCGTVRLPGSPTTQAMFVARLNPASGSWAGAWAVRGSFPNQMKALAVTDSATVYVTGASAGIVTFGTTRLTCNSAPGSCGFVAKFSPTAGWLWARDWGSRGSSVGYSVVIEPVTGDPIIGGEYRAPVVLDTISLPGLIRSGLIARVNARSGAWMWATTSSPRGTTGPPIDNLARDAAGTLYASGFVNLATQSVIFGSDTAYLNDTFIASADSRTGQWQHAWVITGGSGGNIRSLMARAPGEVALGGNVGAISSQFGPFTVPVNPADGTAYVARLLDPNHPVGLPATAATALALWPNPATGTVYLRLTVPTAAAQQLEVRDVLGRCCRTVLLPPHQTEARLSLDGLPPGLYFVQCGTLTRRLVVSP